MIPMKRFLLMLLIAFAVPVQGLAAVNAGICMAVGHHDAPGQVFDHDHAPVAAVQADSDDGDADQGNGHCGSAGSIASSPAPVVPVIAGLAVQTQYAGGPAGAPPDSLERPPLVLL